MPDLDAFNPASAYLEWQYRLPVSVPRSDIADIFDFIGPECKLSIEEVDAEPVLEEIAATPAPEFILKAPMRSEEHTSELKSLMRISYAVFCLKKKKKNIYIIILDLIHYII